MLGGKKAYQKEPLDLVEAVREAISRLQAKADAAGFILALQAETTRAKILGDHRAVVQALTNLIDNAMKCAGTAKTVDITVAAEGDRAIIRVTDHGIGIAQEDQAQIFKRFYRVD